MAKIHQEVTFHAAPAKVYAALTNGAQHSKFTGAPAEIGGKDGDAWSAYGGQIHGRQLELVDGVRIVQSWRGKDWPAGVHSVARFELTREGDHTKLVLDHDGVPEKDVQHIDPGWAKMYWEKLRPYVEA